MTVLMDRKYDLEKLISLCDGVRTSKEIAKIVGCPPKYVQKQFVKFDLPRPKRAPPCGERNPSAGCGRIIDRDGYAWLAVPPGVPRAFYRKNRTHGRIREHHLVAMEVLGRKLKNSEVVDHIDGIKIHNHPKNIRVFRSNADHLKATISGNVPNWSAAGKKKLQLMNDNRGGKGYLQNLGLPVVDSYRQRKVSGDVRLQQILLAYELLGKDSPFLLGTGRYLEKTGIVLHQKLSTYEGLKCLLRECGLDRSQFLLTP